MSLSTDLAIAAARDLTAALWSLHSASPISPLSYIKFSTIKVMAGIFKSTFEEARDNKDEEPLPSIPPMALPGDNQPEKELPAAEPRVLKILSQPSPQVQPLNTAPEPRVEKPPKIAPHITYVAATQNINATSRRKMKSTTPTQTKNLLNSPNSSHTRSQRPKADTIL